MYSNTARTDFKTNPIRRACNHNTLRNKTLSMSTKTTAHPAMRPVSTSATAVVQLLNQLQQTLPNELRA